MSLCKETLDGNASLCFLLGPLQTFWRDSGFQNTDNSALKNNKQDSPFTKENVDEQQNFMD